MLRELVYQVVVTIGVAGLSTWILSVWDSNPVSWFATLSYGWKRFWAIAIAVLAVTGLWLTGVLWLGYFPYPGDTVQLWVEAWFELVMPAAVLQQLINGFTRKEEVG